MQKRTSSNTPRTDAEKELELIAGKLADAVKPGKLIEKKQKARAVELRKLGRKLGRGLGQ